MMKGNIDAMSALVEEKRENPALLACPGKRKHGIENCNSITDSTETKKYWKKWRE